MEGWLIFFGIVGAIWLIAWINNRLSELQKQVKKYVELKPRVDNLDNYKRQLESKESELRDNEIVFETLVKEKSQGFPWLAQAYAEYLHLQDIKRADYLKHKWHPALTAAEHLREVASQRKIAEERYRVLKYQLESYRQEIGIAEVEGKQRELDYLAKRLAEERQAIDELAEEKSIGFPWLAKAYDDYFELQDVKMAEYLETKPQPAVKAAEDHRQIAKERRDAERAARLSNYLLDYCRYLAPWLDDYIGLEAGELDEIIKEIHSAWEKKEQEFDEEVKRHFGPKYEGLTPTEKLQKKLDWYWGKPNKPNWQIGRDYERYIGYLYEAKGWNVQYHGKKGFEDLGRDLICKKERTAEIIQCKYWAKEKIIHEKHIYYLFGTTVEYYLENFGSQKELQLAMFPSLIQKRNVIPKLITTIEISTKAEQVAKVLGVAVEKIPFQQHYPSIKCNVARRTGEKIFHLPFDQQYDTATIEEERLEYYVATVAEAEALGFRHAYRWNGEGNKSS